MTASTVTPWEDRLAELMAEFEKDPGKRTLLEYGGLKARAVAAEIAEWRALAAQHVAEGVLRDGAVKYGCHIDLPEGEYDACVLDEGDPENCVYASRYGEEGRKKCGEWKPVKVVAAPVAAQPVGAVSDALFRSRTADLLHLTQHYPNISEGDEREAQKAIADLNLYLAASVAVSAAPSGEVERDAAQSLDSLRIQVYAQGMRLEDDVLDPEEIASIGAQLRKLTQICDYCHGSGEDGDDADANGEGGWSGRCYKCGGSGLAAITATKE